MTTRGNVVPICSRGSRIEIPARHERNLFHVTYSGLDEDLPFIDNRDRTLVAKEACVASALRAATSGVVVRRTAVTAITLTESPTEVHRGNPLEVVEHIATSHSCPFERTCEDELVIVVRGKWCDYQVSFTWMHDMEALHLACAFELKAPERSNAEIGHLIPMINAQMWGGHFEFWPADRLVVFRHTLVLSGGAQASGRQCEVLLSAALDAGEQYYSAFQFVAWASAGAREALEAAMFETAGEA
jgi:hypothetical protein